MTTATTSQSDAVQMTPAQSTQSTEPLHLPDELSNGPGLSKAADAALCLQVVLRSQIEVIVKEQAQALQMKLANLERLVVTSIAVEPLQDSSIRAMSEDCISPFMSSLGSPTPIGEDMRVSRVSSEASRVNSWNVPSAFSSAASRSTHVPCLNRTLGGQSRSYMSLEDLESIRAKLHLMVTHRAFEIISAFWIATNAMFIGACLQFVDPDTPSAKHIAIQAIQLAYMTVFLAELILRIVAHGKQFFWSQDWAWNYFDLVIVTSSVIDEIMSSLLHLGSSGLSIMRMTRILRILRVLRVFRIFRYLRNLRVLIVSIMSAVRSLTWALVLLGLNIYGFSCIFTQAVRSHDNYYHHTFALQREHFGTTARTAYTLFSSISGGVSWAEVTKPMFEVGWMYVILFIFYIAFTQLAMLNVITGVFCQNAIEFAERDEDEIIQELMKQKDQLVDKIRRIFVGIESEKKDSVSLAEFEDHMMDEKAQAVFKTLGLEVSDAESLFKLLDYDKKGSVNLMEFVMGCLELRGHAKCIDIAKLRCDNTKMMREHKAIQKQLRAILCQGRGEQMGFNLSSAASVSADAKHSISRIASTESASIFEVSRQVECDTPSRIPRDGQSQEVPQKASGAAMVLL